MILKNAFGFGGNFFLSDFKRTDLMYRVFRRLPATLRGSIIDTYVNFAKKSSRDRVCPERLTLFLTNQCNMKCAHCFIVKEVQPKIVAMTLEDYRKLFKSVKGNVSQVLFTGGEATLRSDFPDIVISAFKDGSIPTANIFSNGLKTDRVLSQLQVILDQCDIKINYQTSLDGLEEFHDRNRRVPNGFRNAIATIKGVQALKQKYPNRFGRLVTTAAISRQNLRELREIAETIENTGASAAFAFVRTSADVFNLRDESLKSSFTPEETKADGSVKFANNDFLSVAEMDEALKVLETTLWSRDIGSLHYRYNRATLRAIRNSKASAVSPLTDECRMGFDDVVILADGLVSRCENLAAPSELRDFDFDLPKLLLSQKWKDFMDRSSGCWCTHDCGIGVSMMKEKPLLRDLR